MKIKRTISERANKRFKSLCLTLGFVSVVALLSESALGEIKSYLLSDTERYSGLFVSANGTISQDGEPSP